MKKVFLLISVIGSLLFSLQAEDNTRSNFRAVIDLSKYKEVTVPELNRIYGASNKSSFTNEQAAELEKVYLKVKCHVVLINPYDDYFGHSISFYGNGQWTNGLCQYDFPFPKEMPLFTTLEVYFHFVSLANFDFSHAREFNYIIDGWKVLDEDHLIGQEYIATDGLKVRSSPALSGSQTGRLEKKEHVTVTEIGDKAVIDGIESSWVKIKTEKGMTGWCFGGYLTDGEEYKQKQWTSKAQ